MKLQIKFKGEDDGIGCLFSGRRNGVTSLNEDASGYINNLLTKRFFSNLGRNEEVIVLVTSKEDMNATPVKVRYNEGKDWINVSVELDDFCYCQQTDVFEQAFTKKQWQQITKACLKNEDNTITLWMHLP